MTTDQERVILALRGVVEHLDDPDWLRARLRLVEARRRRPQARVIALRSGDRPA